MKEDISIALQMAVLAIQTGIILFAARFAGNLAKKLHLPQVLGELLSGIVLGHCLLGSIGLGLPGLENGLFPDNGSGLPVSLPLYALATIGSIILLFISGLETDLRQFFRYSLAGTAIGFGGALVSFIFGAGLGMFMFRTGMMDPRCLFLGILCTATSVGITARILQERKAVDSPEGTTILAAAVIDDVLGIIGLAIVMGIVGAAGSRGGEVNWAGIGWIAIKSIGIWLGVTVLGVCFSHRIAGFLKLFRNSRNFSVLAFGLALLLSGIFEEAGLAMIVGAYVMGLSLSGTDIAFSLQRNLNGLNNFFVPLFFVVMGMLVDVSVFADGKVLKYGLIYSLLAVAAKVIGCALPARFMGFNMLGSLRIGMGMIPRGEVALIIAGIGSTTMMVMDDKKVPVIDNSLFGIAVIMTLTTTIAAPPLLSWVLGLKGRGVNKETAENAMEHTTYELPSETIRELVLRTVMDNFRKEGFRHSALDRDGGIIRFRRDRVSFSLHIEENQLDFESDSTEAALIRCVMFETFVEIQRTAAKLKEFAGSCELTGMIPLADSGRLPMHPERIFNAEHICMDLRVKNFEAALTALIAKLEESGQLLNGARSLGDVLEREEISPTILPGGIALPHARTGSVTRLTAALGISPGGIPAGNGEKIHIIVLILCPMEFDTPYLQFLSRIAKILGVPEKVQKIIAASDPEDIRRIFS